MKILTQSLPPATVGEAYYARLDVVDGLEPYTWALDGASDPLPPGLSLAANGEITGTPFGAPQTHTNLIFEATDSTPASLSSSALTLLVQPGVYKKATTYLMEDKINDMVTRIFGDGDQVSRFEFMRHFYRSRDVGSGEPEYLQKLAFLHDSGQIQSPLLVNAGLAAGNSVRAALILLDTLIGGGAALPFTILPAPSGDVTGATDTAALNAVWTNPATLDWLVIPRTAGTPYYINANITSGATRNFKLWASDTLSYHFISAAGALEVQDLVECRDVWFNIDVIPRSQPGAGVGAHLRIYGGYIEVIGGTYLFPDGVGEIRHAEFVVNTSGGIGGIATDATYLKVEDNRISKVGLGGLVGITLLAISGALASQIVISNNQVSSLIDDTAAGGGSIWDLRGGTAASVAIVGPNSYGAPGIVSPYNSTGHLGAVAVSPQAFL